MEPNTHLFYTTDLPLVVFLSMYQSYTDISWKGMKVNFGFDKTADLLDLVEAYIKQQAVVEPQRFYEKLLEIRREINKISKLHDTTNS